MKLNYLHFPRKGQSHLERSVPISLAASHKYSGEMKISQATALLRTPLIEWVRPQDWCDLGCGTGTFTTALAELLAPGSTIHAVDLDQKALEEIPDRYDGVQIRKILGDLRSSNLRLPSVDGILMANSLHFIREQHLLLKRLVSLTDRFLIVEYERSRPNLWGPFPVGFAKLCELFSEVGVERVEKLATTRSRFGGAMYSAAAERSRA
jgi:SAM-dependent methyltransferase